MGKRYIQLCIVNAILLAICVVVFFVMTFNCNPYKGYTGEYPQLFTVAVNEIPDARGFISSEREHQPVVCFIEKDEQGRMLFCYCEGYREGAQIYLMVCQSAVEGNAYYYEGAYAVATVSDVYGRIGLYGSKRPAQIDAPLLDFTDEQIETVKTQNDWGQELNLEKCAKASIIRKVGK